MPAIPRRHVPNNPPSLLGGGGFNFENKRGYSKPVWLNSVGKMAVVVALAPAFDDWKIEVVPLPIAVD